MATKYPTCKNDHVFSHFQSGYKIHAGFATHFALSAGLFLLSWGNTLLSQGNHKAIGKTEAGRGPWSWGLRSCLGQALLKAGPTALGCSGLWALGQSKPKSQSTDPTASLGLSSSVWPGLWGTDSPYDSTSISHLPHRAHCPLCKLWEEPGSISISALTFDFVGLGEVPDGRFLGLKLSGLLSG